MKYFLFHLAYEGYKENVDTTIYNVFATSAFRAGHSMVRPAFSRLDENFEPISEDIPLVKAFFNNTLLQINGYAPFILGLLGNVSETINRGMAEGLTKHLFQQPGSDHGFDLAALNIQRGRDHGLPGYGAWRRECGLDEAIFFDETENEIKNAKARNILHELYPYVEHSDLWVAGLAEDHVPGAMVGPTFHCILKRQFTRLRDADRFWYERPDVFTSKQLAELKKVSLSRVICDNLYNAVSLQPDAFLAATIDNQRVECQFGLPFINLSKWKEGKQHVNQDVS
jgi:peroxidase